MVVRDDTVGVSKAVSVMSVVQSERQFSPCGRYPGMLFTISPPLRSTCRTLVIVCDNGAIWRHRQIWKTMKFFHDNFLLCVSFVSLFVIITAEDHVRGVPFPLGMLQLNNAACSKCPASMTKCKRGKATARVSGRRLGFGFA